ncbi:hypothetical protein GOP47_0002283 [Adiantum capillus-veneris]|uniref:Uncharacterized protein n=1 Tax=Adiantum capillus-veneris TaxID=13818 RepID=A0A9D4ZRH6_ADICA|nr:hypothetical protein GOP47_0002283 [Adiantum capillus-veneris]
MAQFPLRCGGLLNSYFLAMQLRSSIPSTSRTLSLVLLLALVPSYLRLSTPFCSRNSFLWHATFSRFSCTATSSSHGRHHPFSWHFSVHTVHPQIALVHLPCSIHSDSPAHASPGDPTPPPYLIGGPPPLAVAVSRASPFITPPHAWSSAGHLLMELPPYSRPSVAAPL